MPVEVHLPTGRRVEERDTVLSTEADEARHGRAQHLLEYEAPGTALLVVFHYAHLRLRAGHALRLI